MIYLTYNDLPSGIYNSQVIDVCKFYKNKLNINIRLIAFVSLRGFWANRKKIKGLEASAIIIPMIPRHKNWRMNKYLLAIVLFFIKNKVAICRGPFATNIALDLKSKKILNKVIFDARGAYKAEFNEYLSSIVKLNDDIGVIEKRAIEKSDNRLAISAQLVKYWKEEYDFTTSRYVVIPCTLSNQLISVESKTDKKEFLEKRKLNDDDIVLVYSGSTADWQSIEIIDDFLMKNLLVNVKIKMFFLAKFDLKKLKSFFHFPERIFQEWVSPESVNSILEFCDYGLLIREKSITNKVASPTKFAEYLHAGLKIIISPNIGDFSQMVKENNLGEIWDNKSGSLSLSKLSFSEKEKMKKIAIKHFSKEVFEDKYRELVLN